MSTGRAKTPLPKSMRMHDLTSTTRHQWNWLEVVKRGQLNPLGKYHAPVAAATICRLTQLFRPQPVVATSRLRKPEGGSHGPKWCLAVVAEPSELCWRGNEGMPN